jgi:hypothetical protein
MGIKGFYNFLEKKNITPSLVSVEDLPPDLPVYLDLFGSFYVLIQKYLMSFRDKKSLFDAIKPGLLVIELIDEHF